MTSSIRVRFLGAEREFVVRYHFEDDLRRSAEWHECDLGGGVVVKFYRVAGLMCLYRGNKSVAVECGDSAQSAATALEEALRPLAEVLACLDQRSSKAVELMRKHGKYLARELRCATTEWPMDEDRVPAVLASAKEITDWLETDNA